MRKEIDPGSKVQLRAPGQLMHPGACAVCGTGTCDEGFVDPGIYFDYEGQVYFCMTCMDQIGSTIGYLTEKEADFLQQQNSEYLLRISELESELEDALGRLHSYNKLLVNAVSDVSVPITGVVAYQTDNADSFSPPAVISDDASGASEGKSVITKPVARRRSNNVKQSKLRNEPKFAV